MSMICGVGERSRSLRCPVGPSDEGFHVLLDALLTAIPPPRLFRSGQARKTTNPPPHSNPGTRSSLRATSSRSTRTARAGTSPSCSHTQ